MAPLGNPGPCPRLKPIRSDFTPLFWKQPQPTNHRHSLKEVLREQCRRLASSTQSLIKDEEASTAVLLSCAEPWVNHRGWLEMSADVHREKRAFLKIKQTWGVRKTLRWRGKAVPLAHSRLFQARYSILRKKQNTHKASVHFSPPRPPPSSSLLGSTMDGTQNLLVLET